jgi:hypothetical protein
MVTLFVKGILCNMLVCMGGGWIAYAGRSATDKIVGLILPISAFVAAGFEHCIANMYFLPLAWLLTEIGKVPAGFDFSLITIPGIIHNLVPVTLGSHAGWAAPVVFVLAFCESFTFVSLIVPATVILFGVGGLIGASGIELWPVWLGAALGAIVRDWLAYSLAYRFKDVAALAWTR